MVRELWDRLVTSLGLTRCKQDTIELWVMSGPGTSYMQKFMLSSEQDMTMLRELLSMSPVMIDEENLQKLNRAGLAHKLFEMQECCGSCTPQQMELNLMTSNDYEQLHEAWNDET